MTEKKETEVEGVGEELTEESSTSKQYSKDDLIKAYEKQIHILNIRLEEIRQPSEEEKKLIELDNRIKDIEKYVQAHHQNLETLNENFKLLLDDKK